MKLSGLKEWPRTCFLTYNQRSKKNDDGTHGGSEHGKKLEVKAKGQPVPCHTTLREINLKYLLILKLQYMFLQSQNVTITANYEFWGMEKGSTKNKKQQQMENNLQETTKEGDGCITKNVQGDMANPGHLLKKGASAKANSTYMNKSMTYLLSWSIDNPDPCSTSLVKFTISSFRARIVSFAFCSLSQAESTIFQAFSISYMGHGTLVSKTKLGSRCKIN